MAHRTLSSGTLLAKRYRVERLIKAGGFAAVYVAVDQMQHKRCAVKETFDASVEGSEQFRLEGEILAGVRHTNLPEIWDYFQHGGGLYLVMEYIEGEDLESQLELDEYLPEDPVRAWAIQICDALTELHWHEPPIIHRDIKPANIKITPDGKAVLIDFGIAKLYRAGNNTQVAARAVTDGFSPLEQYGQGSTDARSDVYALGATIYNLLTGVIPPDAPSRVTEETLVPPRSLKLSISQAMELLILRSLSLRPSERYQTAEEMRRALIATAQPPPPRPPTGVLSVTGGLHTTGGLSGGEATGQLVGQREGRAGPWWCSNCQTRNPPQNGFCAQCGTPAPTIEIDLLEMPTRLIAPLSSPPRSVYGKGAHGWEAMPGPPNAILTAVAGGPEQGLVACGERGLVLVHNREVWVPLPTPTSYILKAIAAATGHVWAVGEYGTVVHFTGGRWSVFQSEVDETLQAIALDDPVSGWIAGSDGTLIELRDQTLYPQPTRRHPVHGMAIDDVGDGWAVGEGNVLLRLTHGQWKTRASTQPLGTLNGVAHLQSGEAWAVGEHGMILRIDDNGWEIIPSLDLPDLYAVAFNRRGEGWAVGDQGALAWFDGEHWTVPPQAAPTGTPLRSVAWSNDGEAWAIGDHGVVLRWRR